MSRMLIQFKGVSDNSPTQGEAWDGTENLYIDGEGYVCNYPGKTDIFRRPSGQPPQGLGPAPATNVAITRLRSFIDPYGEEHIVFVRGSELCEKYGNGYRVLTTLTGDDKDGKFYPYMFLHDSKLVILNKGSFPLIWDGHDKPHPIGVTEAPLAPRIWAQKAPGQEGLHPTGGSYVHLGPWVWAHLWWPQTQPQSGPGSSLDINGDPVQGHIRCAVQFVDKYGNKGPMSPLSNVAIVKPPETIGSGAPGEHESNTYCGCDWYPPLQDPHIYGVVVGRTLNLNPSDASYSVGREALVYTDEEYEGVTLSRHMFMADDGTIVLNNEMDSGIIAAPNAVIGCSWLGRIWLVSEDDRNLLYPSDAGLFGQFRIPYKAIDNIVAVIPLSSPTSGQDNQRLVVITESTTEIVYESEGLFGSLNQDLSDGSSSGFSFVDVGGGAIFGLWKNGFGFYDGTKHVYIEVPYYIQNLYLDEGTFIANAKKVGEMYIATVRRDYQGDSHNALLIYNFKFKMWFVIDESVYDFDMHKGALIGSSNTISELFKGAYPESSLSLRHIVPEDKGVWASRTLESIRLLMQPSSTESVSITVEAASSRQSAQGGAPLIPGKATSDRDIFTESYWGQLSVSYKDEPEWSSPKDRWITPRLDTQVNADFHDVYFSFPAGHQIKIKAIMIGFSEDTPMSF